MKSSFKPSFFDKYLYFFVHLKGLFTHRFSRTYYGQWGEDVVVDRLLPKKEGFYVDVGAYHPMHYSNTYLLYKKGWCGVNIEPNPLSIRLFNIHRRRDVNVNAGVSKEAVPKRYFIFNHQSCNTFSIEQKTQSLMKPFVRLIGERDVPCFPLRTLFAKHVRGKRIDFLNIDVEGMSMEALYSIDWNETQPEVICIEDDYFDFANKDNFGSEIYVFLSTKSYNLYAKMGLSCIYKLSH